MEFFPLCAFFATIGFSIGFALKTNMGSKLYREMAISAMLGTGLTYTYPYYYRRIYLNVIDEAYDAVMMKIQKDPKFGAKLESQD